jgi:hypothetical protein
MIDYIGVPAIQAIFAVLKILLRVGSLLVWARVGGTIKYLKLRCTSIKLSTVGIP